MADGKVELSLVVPCFNEAPCVEAFVVRAVDAAGVGSDARLEVVFVDDGSTDGTLEIVRALAARDVVGVRGLAECLQCVGDALLLGIFFRKVAHEVVGDLAAGAFVRGAPAGLLRGEGRA